jgi:hypothetical protein
MHRYKFSPGILGVGDIASQESGFSSQSMSLARSSFIIHGVLKLTA